MPKGIYQRGKAPSAPTVQSISKPTQGGELRTVTVSELPTRQSANANVESMRQTHGDEEVSTTERLFGDIALRDKLDETDPNREEEIIQRPSTEEEAPAPVPEPPKNLEEAPKPAESNPEPQEDFIDWEKMAGKKIRQKIDGKEVIVTAEELKKYSDQDQIKKHLAEAADKVGDERRKLAEERRQLQELRQQRPEYKAPLSSGQPEIIPGPQGNYVSGNPDPVLQRIQFLEAQIQQLAQGTQPVIYQSNRQRVADELRNQGFSDFMDYIPKMEAHMSGVQDPQLAGFYDTPQGAKSLYFQLKAMDMQKAPAKPVPHGTVENQAVKNPTPPAIQVDGGSPSSGSHIDNGPHLYRQAFRRATSLGDDKEAWNEVLRQKGILPD